MTSTSIARAQGRMSVLGALMIGVIATAGFAQDFPVTPDPTEKPHLPPPNAPAERTPAERVLAGWAAYPLGASPTSAAVPENTIQLYKDANFKDDARSIDLVTNQPIGAVHDLPGNMEDSVSSLRWNLPPGVVVIFYESDDGRGEQLAIWGQGEMSDLHRWNFDNKASSWAWYDAGSLNVPPRSMGENATRPNGTRESAVALPDDSMQLFKNREFKGDSETISPVTAQAPGELHRLPSHLADHMTSLRWNLPPGVVVTFYEDSGGKGRQATIFGRGEVPTVSEWKFNDMASRWSWNYVGSRRPANEPLGYTAPAGAYAAAIDAVARAIEPNKLNVTGSDLVAVKNPSGEGTLVYVPKTRFDGVQRRLVWLVLDSQPYAVSGAAKSVTPFLPTPSTADESLWARTGLSRIHAEEDAIALVFPRDE